MSRGNPTACYLLHVSVMRVISNGIQSGNLKVLFVRLGAFSCSDEPHYSSTLTFQLRFQRMEFFKLRAYSMVHIALQIKELAVFLEYQFKFFLNLNSKYNRPLANYSSIWRISKYVRYILKHEDQNLCLGGKEHYPCNAIKNVHLYFITIFQARTACVRNEASKEFGGLRWNC